MRNVREVSDDPRYWGDIYLKSNTETQYGGSLTYEVVNKLPYNGSGIWELRDLPRSYHMIMYDQDNKITAKSSY